MRTFSCNRVFLIILASSLTTGCLSSSTIPTIHRPADWDSLGPHEMLRVAGRICCDASTFEAIGTLNVRSDRRENESVRIRWGLGPDGEYRFERGSRVVVHDTQYVSGAEEGRWSCWANETGRLLGRSGPHHRYSGDLIMAAGMMGGDAMTFPTAAARLLGADWLEALCQDESSLEFGPDETIRGHVCRTILFHTGGGEHMTIHIDSALGVVRGWRLVSRRKWEKSAYYDVIRLNPNISEDEFRIPATARRPYP